MKPDRVVFNALIAACAQSGAVDRAFDVLEEMETEIQPIEPDHITFGALMKACTNAGQVLFLSSPIPTTVFGSSCVFSVTFHCI